ncbi:conserved hypothetical protein [Gloeothece citriformis PCC 7424]|uniref:Uncharacterized protein n=1 Tax=Gloeothece citriformis (strain PCC 7424) TaxID=65393 RepID=B7KIQ7_GLOC7|nr:hypothetical protein [Gloeothece citriformis]ACK69463.1 conserved hypothetical protein [Gloeothece citriformis PCC 7424]
MAHTFLVEAGRWAIEGTWVEKNHQPILVKGRTLVAWTDDTWFTMVTKLIFPGTQRDEIAYQCRGRLDGNERHYTYVLQQSLLGQVEGEGWIGVETIIQRYWVLGDRLRRSGFETFYRLNQNKYHLSSGILAAHYLTSTLEATLERQL